MNPAQEERILGEYRLKNLLSKNAISTTWLAEQTSVSRLVLVDELRADQSEQRDAFLADVRAKAAIDHPLIGSVYEAVASPGLCYCAYELLPGTTLAMRADTKQRLASATLANILLRVAETHFQHETLGQATSPLGLDALHQDKDGVVRLKNLAVAGPRTSEQSKRDIFHLGNALVPLIISGQPGATRMMTVCAWMRGEGLEAPLTWEQIRDFCLQIEHQLANPAPALTATLAERAARKRQTIVLVTLATVVVTIGITLLASRMRLPKPSSTSRPKLPDAVAVAAGDYPMPDGSVESQPAFRISAQEITIGQYAEFLEILGTLAKDGRQRTFDPPNQAPEKTSHEPADWAAQLAAAKTHGIWQNQPITFDFPVTGVDWWDAAAYAEWKKARLPTQEEWFSALHLEERATVGLLGMVGNVCEWAAKPATNPANPLGEKLWVVIGGSYLKPGSSALTREWTTNRSLRRPDLGFRVLFEGE